MRWTRAFAAACLVLVALVTGALVLGGEGMPSETGGAQGSSGTTAGELLSGASAGGGADGLVSTLAGRDDVRTSSEDGVAVDERAEALLGEYASRGDCVVARSGWLDLLGRTWGCVIQGEGWADVCVVTAREGGGSELAVMHMDASGLCEELGGSEGRDD